MPLPPSGTITINQIRTELGSLSGSLRTLSSLAGFSTPDAMSEFWGYSATRPVNLYNYSSDGYIQINVNSSWYYPIYGYGSTATFNVPVGASLYAGAGDSAFGSNVQLYINGVNVGSWSGYLVITSTYTVASGNTYDFYHYEGF